MIATVNAAISSTATMAGMMTPARRVERFGGVAGVRVVARSPAAESTPAAAYGFTGVEEGASGEEEATPPAYRRDGEADAA